MAINEELTRIIFELDQLEAADPATRIALCSKALVLLKRDEFPELWAQFQIEFGAALMALPSGDRANNLDHAITAFYQGLEVMTPEAEAHPLECGRAMSLMAEAWTQRPGGNRDENLKHAIETYHMMLVLLDPSAHRLQWADTVRKLGDAHFELGESGKSESLDLAIEAYERALPFIPATEYPADVFELRYNLACAYMSRQGGSRSETLDRAVSICQQGLEDISRDTLPRVWAGLHALLATALLQRTHADRAEDIQQAITHLQLALHVVKRETMPSQWATIMYNIGLAFSSRPTLDPARNQQAAIRAYTDALEIHTREAAPVDWANNMSGLATAYMRLSILGVADLAQKGIETYKEALTVFNHRDTPAEWGRTQANLGDAYLGRPDGERTANLERAIDAYSQALQTITKERDPSGWAQIQQRLGTAHAACAEEGRSESSHSAIAAYENALAVRSLEGMPREHRETQRSLGDLFFEGRDWARAHAAYSSSIEATDLLYESTYTPQRQLSELRESRDLPARSAYCLAKLGRFAEAVEVLEDGRAHALVEALSLANAAHAGISESDREAFSNARSRIADAEARSRQGPRTHVTLLSEMLKVAKEDVSKLPTSGRDFLDVSGALRGARSDLEEAAERIREYRPDFLTEGWSIAEIVGVATLLAKPLVYVVTTQHGSLAIIVLPNSPAFQDTQVVWLDGCNTGEVDRLLFSADGDRRYLYSNVPNTPLAALQAKLDEMWSCLKNELMGPIESRLAGMGHRHAVVVPMGLLGLAPLSAVMDSIRVSIAPSVRAIQTSHGRVEAAAQRPRRLFGVANPLPSPEPLPFARQEVDTILCHFPRETATVLHEEKATRDATSQGMTEATHLHFACHGTFNIAEPLDSALSLAGTDKLTLRDVLDPGLKLSNARLVVLSACRTGIIDYQTVADEVVGFAAAFLRKGIPGVITSLWPVPDFPTALLLDRFYSLHVVEGMEPAEALHLSQRWLRDITAAEIVAQFERKIIRPAEECGMSVEQAAEICHDFGRMDPKEVLFAHPFYWAAFIFSGS